MGQGVEARPEQVVRDLIRLREDCFCKISAVAVQKEGVGLVRIALQQMFAKTVSEPLGESVDGELRSVRNNAARLMKMKVAAPRATRNWRSSLKPLVSWISASHSLLWISSGLPMTARNGITDAIPNNSSSAMAVTMARTARLCRRSAGVSRPIIFCAVFWGIGVLWGATRVLCRRRV